MNKLVIIGNICRAPELRQTQSGLSVCTFTVAVNRRRQTNNDQPEADYFRVSAWRQLGENCAKYLSKGRKVCVIGPVSLSTYKGQDGQTRANMEITAEDVEFLSPKENAPTAPKQANTDAEERYKAEEREAIQNEKKYVDATPENDDDLPF